MWFQLNHVHVEKLSFGIWREMTSTPFLRITPILEKVDFALALTRGPDRGAIAIDGMASLAHPSSVSISIFNHRESSNRREEGRVGLARRMLLCVVVGHY